MFVNLIKAKTCNGCKAKLESYNPYFVKCELDGFECTSDGKPLTKCPKPNTLKVRSNLGIASSRGELIFSTDLPLNT